LSSNHPLLGGGNKGPSLTTVRDRPTAAQLTSPIAAGGGGMPAYSGPISPAEMRVAVEFLQGLRSPSHEPPATPLAR
jgi:mono/diheme cytochrome c family protein